MFSTAAGTKLISSWMTKILGCQRCFISCSFVFKAKCLLRKLATRYEQAVWHVRARETSLEMASDWAWLKVAIMYRSSSPGLAGKKRQKTSSMSSKMIVVLPVPPAPIKRHACCARFRKGVLFSSSCKATSIASPNQTICKQTIAPAPAWIHRQTFQTQQPSAPSLQMAC